MSKSSRRPRSASPTRYGRGPGQTATQPSPTAQKTSASRTEAAPRAPAMTRAQAAAVNFAEEYRYVYRDLRRMAILAGAIVIVLIVLSFII